MYYFSLVKIDLHKFIHMYVETFHYIELYQNMMNFKEKQIHKHVVVFPSEIWRKHAFQYFEVFFMKKNGLFIRPTNLDLVEHRDYDILS